MTDSTDSQGADEARGRGAPAEAGETDVVVVGAGVAGLNCAAVLGRAGLRVTVVEARDRVGGRIHTVCPPGAPFPVELGAEFVHGTPPDLLELLREAALPTVPALESAWRAAADGLRPARWQEETAESLFDALDANHAPDRTVAEFLGEWTRRHPESAAVAASARDFVAGFHAADPALMGERALAHEMAATDAEGGDRSVRIPAGYNRVAVHLRDRLGAGVSVRLGAAVTAIRWRAGLVTLTVRSAATAGSVSEAGGQAAVTLTAPRAVLTLPIGVLRAAAEDGGLRPQPMPDGQARALEQLYMGQARRIVLHFRERLWESDQLRAPGVTDSLSGMGFLQSPREAVPVWWTAAPLRQVVITGWLGGPRAERLTGASDEQAIEVALASLAGALRLPRQRLADSLVRGLTYDWGADRWARGAYSYAGMDGTDARRALAQPVDDTLYWAGEATHWTGSAGTVHGALASGHRAANELLRSMGR